MNLRKLFSATIIITRRKGKFTYGVNVRQLEDAEKLVTLFQGMTCQAYFTGGAGIAWSIGDFYRYHNDFDIAVFIDNLETLATHLKSKRFRLVKRYFITHISPWHDIQVMIDFNPRSFDQAKRDSTRLKGLIKGAPFRVIKRRYHLFDIFAWNKSKDGVLPIGHSNIIPWNDFYPATRISVTSNLFFLNIHHKKYIPQRTEREKIDYERAGIKPVVQ